MLQPSHLEFYRSSQTNSDGGTISATAIPNGQLDNLFASIPQASLSLGGTTYRKIFLKNNHSENTVPNVYIWIDPNTLSTDDTLAIGLGSASDTSGAAITYSTPTDKVSGLAVASLAPGAGQAIWIRRVVGVGASVYTNNQATIRVEGDDL